MNKISVILTRRAYVFQREIVAGVELQLEDQYELVIEEVEVNPTGTLSSEYDPTDYDGILVVSNVLTRGQLRDLHHSGTPITMVSHREYDLPMPAIIQNNADGMKQLVRYVVEECGRNNIVFIRGDMNQHDGIQRDQLFQEGLMRYDLTTADHNNLVGNFDPVTAANSMVDFLESEQPFDAVIASDYLMGCAVLDVMRAYDVNIPNDVSVVAFGDGPEAQDMGLTVVGVDVVEIGRRAARQLLGQLNGMSMTGVTWLNTELIIRDSS